MQILPALEYQIEDILGDSTHSTHSIHCIHTSLCAHGPKTRFPCSTVRLNDKLLISIRHVYLATRDECPVCVFGQINAALVSRNQGPQINRPGLESSVALKSHLVTLEL